MKKGIKSGARVTGYRWYFPRRVYGKIVRYLGRNLWAVEGGFGLETFHTSQLRAIKVN